MEVIRSNGSYRLIKFSAKFFVLDFSNKTLGIAIKTYINETQAIKEFSILCNNYDTEKRIEKHKLDSMVSGIY